MMGGCMIIAVDYDGTLETNGRMNEALIHSLVNKQRCGATVILWTCRQGTRLQEALQKLNDAGFMPDFVNRNDPFISQRFGYEPRKVYADIYIDDKNAIINGR